MSKETMEWLNTQVLVGFAAKHGKAWHFSPKNQGEEPNHYDGAIPEEDVIRRLFAWDAVARPVLVDQGRDGLQPQKKHKAIVHGETGEVFQIARDTYAIHQYREWLVDRVGHLLKDDNLQIGSAGLLRGGARAWVMVETPETVKSASGMELRPRVLAATSHDSFLASTYKLIQTLVVCDNTLALALRESGLVVRARHTNNRNFSITDAREALDLVVESAQIVAEMLDRLADISVSDQQWQEIVDRISPIPDGSLPRVRARLENTRADYEQLYRSDPRCTPWMGTGLGVFQAFNTHRLYVAGPDDNRFERNMTSVLTKRGERSDIETLRAIDAVCKANLFINN